MSLPSFSTPEITSRVQEWTSPDYNAEMRQEVQALVEAGNVKELEDRFYRTMAFGTGGLRGVVGAGTNRMNRILVAQATQGLAKYVNENATKPGPLRAAIAHDSRHFSREFAEMAACVLAANGIIVHISPELRPTPYLSFAVRHLDCHTGIVVTASHNPKEYNGYKVYWDDGSQVITPHDKGIINEVEKVTSMEQVTTMSFDEGVAKGMIKVMGKEMDEAYLDAILKQRLDEKVVKSTPLRVVYTPLHGCGGTLAIDALKRWGFSDVFPEEEQMKPDGDFPTAASPNPEEGKALARAIELAKREGADLVLATDPDADRLGIAVAHEGEMHLISGNQLSCLVGDYLLGRRKALGILPAKPAIASTIVTTPLLGEIAAHYNARYAEVLTGFKWIANQSREWAEEDPEIEFLYGTEESYGFLIGKHCMDKDGIVASCVVAEMAAWAKSNGKSVVDYLNDLYLRHKPRLEWQKSVTMPGKDGAEKIVKLMKTLMDDPPKIIDGKKVTRRTRVDIGEVYDGQTGKKTGTIDLPSSNVVIFELEDGSKAIARPSGTEPKVKFYFFLSAEKQNDLESTKKALKKLDEQRPDFEKNFLNDIGANA